MCCTAMLIYIGFVFPFESEFLNKIEAFNELAALLLCYFIFCFTDWIPEPEMRYLVGWTFCIGVCSHLATHLFILLRGSYSQLKVSLKTRIAQAKNLKRKIGGKQLLLKYKQRAQQRRREAKGIV